MTADRTASADTAHSTSPHEVHPGAANLAIAASTGFVTIVALLHLLKPELEPSWRMVSEYEIGRHGWLMQAAFLLLSLACLASWRALRRRVAGTSGRLGRAALLAAAVGTALAGVFVTDPVGSTAAELTTRGNLHGLGFAIGMPSILVAASALTYSLRRDPGVGLTRVTLGVMWASVILFAWQASTSGDAFGPEDPVGWPNRLVLLAVAAWLACVGRLARSADSA